MEILLVQLNDLYLGQEQIGQRDGIWMDIEPPAEIQGLVHPELGEEHLCVAIVVMILELEPLPSVKHVELNIWLVPEVLEHHFDPCRLCAQSHQVDGGVRPLT